MKNVHTVLRHVVAAAIIVGFASTAATPAAAQSPTTGSLSSISSSTTTSEPRKGLLTVDFSGYENPDDPGRPIARAQLWSTSPGGNDTTYHTICYPTDNKCVFPALDVSRTYFVGVIPVGYTSEYYSNGKSAHNANSLRSADVRALAKSSLTAGKHTVFSFNKETNTDAGSAATVKFSPKVSSGILPAEYEISLYQYVLNGDSPAHRKILPNADGVFEGVGGESRYFWSLRGFQVDQLISGTASQLSPTSVPANAFAPQKTDGYKLLSFTAGSSTTVSVQVNPLRVSSSGTNIKVKLNLPSGFDRDLISGSVYAHPSSSSSGTYVHAARSYVTPQGVLVLENLTWNGDGCFVIAVQATGSPIAWLGKDGQTTSNPGPNACINIKVGATHQTAATLEFAPPTRISVPVHAPSQYETAVYALVVPQTTAGQSSTYTLSSSHDSKFFTTTLSKAVSVVPYVSLRKNGVPVAIATYTGVYPTSETTLTHMFLADLPPQRTFDVALGLSVTFPAISIDGISTLNVTFAAAEKTKITGSTKVGSTLKLSEPRLYPQPQAVSHQWYIGSKAVKGATGTTFKIPSSAAGQKISVVTKAHRTGFISYNQRTAYTAAVPKHASTITGKISKKTLTTKTSTTVTATVSTKASKTPTGTVTLKVGSKSYKKTLTAASKGKVSFTVKGKSFKRGKTYKTYVKFTPSTSLKSSTTASANKLLGTITVK